MFETESEFPDGENPFRGVGWEGGVSRSGVQVSLHLEKVQDRVTVHMWLFQERDAITERAPLGTGVSGPHPLSTCFDYGPLSQE